MYSRKKQIVYKKAVRLLCWYLTLRHILEVNLSIPVVVLVAQCRSHCLIGLIDQIAEGIWALFVKHFFVSFFYFLTLIFCTESDFSLAFIGLGE